MQSIGTSTPVCGTARVPDDILAAPSRWRLILSGYHGKPTPATLRVATFDRSERVRRAVKALGGFWGAMVVSVFIPVAHFVLVPSLFFVGIWQFFRRLRTVELVRGAHGLCPDCGLEQDFELGSPRVPQSVACAGCHRGLTLAAAGG
jgi:hypothetical protein